MEEKKQNKKRKRELTPEEQQSKERIDRINAIHKKRIAEIKQEHRRDKRYYFQIFGSGNNNIREDQDEDYLIEKSGGYPSL